MANIMVTETCNLRCPYCFAEEFVNKAPTEMTLHDFRTALDFALSDDSDRQVGIIGGEPLLYTHIEEAMGIAIGDPRTDIVMLYTNAVALDRLSPELLRSPKFRMLVNCNAPEDMGADAFERMYRNLFSFQKDHRGEGRFRLSVNIYKPDFDYSYVIPLVQALGFDVIRLSISVPQKGALHGKCPQAYLSDMKRVCMGFVCAMLRCGVITGFDCNFLPGCVLTAEERESMMAAKDVLYGALSGRYSQAFWQRAMLCETQNCTPVIDILPSLQAIRCFGLSEYTKRAICDFSNIQALREHYINTVDRPAMRLWSSEKCKSCSDRECGVCSGGCLLFKAEALFAKTAGRETIKTQ